MDKLLQNYGFVALVIALGVAGLVGAVLLARRSTGARKPRSIADYLLLWPLLFDKERERDPQRGNRLFTARELVGWGVVLALIVLALVFST
jgi:hypothetical protein